MNQNRETKLRAWVNAAPHQWMMEVTTWSASRVSGTYDGKPASANAPAYILMHSSGLKDKKDVEIYEGDLVRFEWGLYEIVFYVGYFGAKLIRGIGKGRRSKDIKPLAYLPPGEVIGNIYENPELLTNGS